jgi:O-antigen/teichoic acid export membrane protein
MGIAHIALLIKRIEAKQRGIIDMTSVLFSGIIGLILALNGFACWGLAIQQVSQTIAATLLRWYFAKWKPAFQFDFSPVKEMFGYSIKLFITSIFAQITNNIFSVILGRLYGKGETGYYAQGNKWAAYGSFTIAGTFSIAQSILVEAKNDVKRQLNVFRKMLRFGAFITFPALLGLAFVGKEFIMITLGEKWADSVIYMQLFCLWGINSYLHSFYSILIWTHEKSNIYMNIMTALFISQLAALIICSSYGILFMIYTYISLYFLSTLAFHFYASRITGLRIKNVIKDLFPYASAAIAAIFIAWLTSFYIDNIYLKFIVKILVTIVIYSAILWFGNSVMFKESLEFLKRKAI